MMGKIPWDDYFMSLAFVVSQRSIDPATKHGTVIINAKDKSILTTGYNSPPRGSDDSIIPLERPDKYPYFVHSEEAAICNAAKHGISLEGSICYCTGHSCEKCFRMLINAGISRLVYGPIGSACVDHKTRSIIEIMNIKNQVEVVEYYPSNCISVLENTIEYYKSKC